MSPSPRPEGSVRAQAPLLSLLYKGRGRICLWLPRTSLRALATGELAGQGPLFSQPHSPSFRGRWGWWRMALTLVSLIFTASNVWSIMFQVADFFPFPTLNPNSRSSFYSSTSKTKSQILSLISWEPMDSGNWSLQGTCEPHWGIILSSEKLLISWVCFSNCLLRT
jgi:hypothetical protein